MRPEPSRVALAPLPELKLAPETLVYREHLSSRGPERTGNWWARIDGDGCYTEAHNSWMWVHDPVLQRSSAWTLHWNGSPRLAPWFCLNPDQLRRLKAAVRAVPRRPGRQNAPGPVDRWTVVGGQRITTEVVPLGARGRLSGSVVEVLEDIAAEGVWGLSPESGGDHAIQATAFLP